jgi:ABC-type nitrate/sulfonate/bicarbonate transport system permease component
MENMNWMKKQRWLIKAITIVLFLAVWEGVVKVGIVKSVLLPAPTAVFSALMETLRTGVLVSDSLASLRRVLVGFLFGSTLGIVTGGLYLNSKIRLILSGPLELIRPIPPLAWVPLSLLWFGFGDPPAYFLVALGAFFPALSATHLGFSRAETSYNRAGRMLGLKPRQIFTVVIVPQALPSILSGLHVGLGVAWMIVVTAELVGAQSGLGYLIQISRAQLQTELVVGGMVVIGLIGMVLNGIMILIERALLPWRYRGREIGTA